MGDTDDVSCSTDDMDVDSPTMVEVVSSLRLIDLLIVCLSASLMVSVSVELSVKSTIGMVRSYR